MNNNKTWEEYKRTLTAEQHKALALEFFNKKKSQLEAEIEQKETELKRLKKELHSCRETILLFEDINTYITRA